MERYYDKKFININELIDNIINLQRHAKDVLKYAMLNVKEELL